MLCVVCSEALVRWFVSRASFSSTFFPSPPRRDPNHNQVGDPTKADFSCKDYSGALIQYPNTYGDVINPEDFVKMAHEVSCDRHRHRPRPAAPTRRAYVGVGDGGRAGLTFFFRAFNERLIGRVVGHPTL